MADDFLQRIASSTRQRVARREKEVPLGVLLARIKKGRRSRPFAPALKKDEVGVIAEIKRASPSKGPLFPGLDPAALAQSYARGGAAALSVLTEPDFFSGSFLDLVQARRAVALPVLCKDFVVEPYQVYEARAFGADAILLIAALHPVPQLQYLRGLAKELDMAALIEVHDEEEVEKALSSGAELVGINNRSLKSFNVDLSTTLKLRGRIPPGVTVVSESGIHTRKDVAALESAGVNAVLIGEALVTSMDPENTIRELLGKPQIAGQTGRRT